MPEGHARDAEHLSRLTSRELFVRARRGDRGALSALFARQLPELRRWARGRLPRWVRDVAETADLIQDALLHTIRRINHVELRGQGALRAYLRQAIVNRINDEYRRFDRRPDEVPLNDQWPDQAPSALARAIDAQNRDRYVAALNRLRQDERELVVGRLELGYSYEQLAVLSNRSTPDAARVAVRRALMKLAEEMSRA